MATFGRLRVLLCRCVGLFCAVFLLLATLHAQSFLQPALVPTGNWPAAIYTADVNGDGYPDLIYIDHGATPSASTTHVLIGDGKGGFTASATIATAGDSIAFSTLPVGGGGGLQTILWVTNDTLGFTIHRASDCGSAGNCVLSSRGPLLFPYANAKTPELHYLTLAKLNPNRGADQYSPELLLEDTANQLLYDVIFNPDGTSVLYSAALPDGAGPLSVVPGLSSAAPVTLVVEGLVNKTAQVFNNGPALAQANLPIPQPTSRIPNVQSLLIRDVNGDGRPDLIAEGTNGHIDVYPGNGDGTFGTTSIGGTGPLDGLTGNGGHLITVADLNHDGQLDALTSTPAGVSTLLGAGTSYLKLGGVYNAGPGHTSYAVADFNGDGNLDLAVDSPEGIAILYGNADGSFQTSVAFPTGAPALSAATGVFTASGKLDVVASTAATQGQLLRGAGDGTLAYNGFPGTPVPTTTKAGTAGLWSVVKAADFDNDGHTDLLFTADGSNANLPAVGSVPGVYLQHGDGNGNFGDPIPAAAQLQFTYPASSSCSPPFDHFPGQFFGTSVIADFNGDGILDYANRDAAAYRIMRGNDGTANNYYFREPTLYWSGVDGAGTTVDCNAHAHDLVATADFNNDGVPDLIFQGFKGSSGSLIEYASDPQRGLPILGDLSVDGSLTTSGQLTAPQINSVFGGVSSTFNQPYFPGAMTTADLDGDGNIDLLVTYANLSADPTNPSTSTPNYLYIWYGSGGGKFLTSAKHPVNPVRTQLSRNYYQVAIADVNNDGIPDLILSDGLIVSYQLGMGDGTFGPEHHLLAGQGINTIATASLRGTRVTDLVIANGGAALANPVANHESLAVDPVVNTGGITVLLNGVTPKAMQATLTASPEPSVFFSAYKIIADESYPTPQTGVVTFYQDGMLLGAVPTVGGIATYSVPAGIEYLPATHALTASFASAGSVGATQSLTGSHVITRAPVTVTLTPTTPLTVYYGQAIDGVFSVQVVDGNYPATGNYTLYDNGAPVAICTAIPTTQACPYGNPVLLDAGSHVFTINYLGDSVNAPGTSPNYTFTILPDTTSLTLASSSNPAYLGQTVTFTSVATGNIVTPVGSVTFTDGAQLNQTRALAAGMATLGVAGLALGTHTINASYPGNLDFNPANAPAIQQQILADLTSITLASSKNPAILGDSVTFTATVSGNYLAPNGAVNFLDAGKVIGGGTVTPGTNNLSTITFTTSSLSVGTHPITAVYVGNASFKSATSAILNEVIQPVPLGTLPSFTKLSSDLNPSAPKQVVTFTAQVQVPNVLPTTATGTVTFFDGTNALGTGTLNSFGVATFQTAALTTGTHPITASYAGFVSTTAPAILPSASAILSQVVTMAIDPSGSGFLMNITPGSLTLNVGHTGIITVSITDVGGFNQPVALTCANLAPETSCTFLPSALVPAGGGNVTLQVATSAPRDCNTNTPYGGVSSNSTPRWPFGIAAATLCFIAIRRRRFKGLLLLVAATALTGISGCGRCTDLGTRPGNYSFQITAVAQGGPVTQTRTVNVPLTMTLPGN